MQFRGRPDRARPDPGAALDGSAPYSRVGIEGSGLGGSREPRRRESGNGTGSGGHALRRSAAGSLLTTGLCRFSRGRATTRRSGSTSRAFDNASGSAGLAGEPRVHQNLVRDNRALGMTPGEPTGIPVGDNFCGRRFLELASRSRTSAREKRESRAPDSVTVLLKTNV